MKTAVIYARYSSDSQTEQSIEGQIHVCQEYASRNDLVIIDTYVDRAMTGTNDNRYDFQRMLKDSNKKQFEVVLVYKLDRFARNRYEAAINRKKLTDNGVSLVSAMENIPDTPEGRLFTSMIEGYNEYYSEDVRQKVNRGLRESWEKGQFTGGTLAFGYYVEKKKVYIDEKEAEVVKNIFNMYSQGYTVPTISKTMLERGIRRKDGRLLHNHFIYNMLGNTKYAGRILFGGKWYDNIYPRIVDESTWLKVQDIRDANKHNPSRRKEVQGFILTGKLVCGECKRMMCGESGTSKTGAAHYYYSCLTKRRRKKPCETKPLNKQRLEDLVINTTWNLLSNMDLVDRIAQELYKLHQKETADNTTLKALEKKKLQAEKSASNLIAALEQGIITEQTKNRLKQLETEISLLEIDINKEKTRTHAFLTPETIKEFLLSCVSDSKDDCNVRKVLVNSLVKEIILTKDNLIILYNFHNGYDKILLTNEEIDQEIQQSQQTAVSSTNSSYIRPDFPPSET